MTKITILEDFCSKAKRLTPDLISSSSSPLSVISFLPDSSAFLRYTPQAICPISDFPSKVWKRGSDFILDFGSHRTGYLSFRLCGEGPNVGDSPTRLRLTFGEVPADVVEDLNPATSPSWISTGWYPDEVINIDECPSNVKIQRRFAFRYVRFQVITGRSDSFEVRFEDVHAIGISSVGELPSPLDTKDELMRRIDQVAMQTLKDCMMTVFEDGPRRDRRLWLGDLRLQALASYQTMPNFNLVKRCLYLFAAFPGPNGRIMACIFERPIPRPAGDFIVDYNAFFVVTVLEYVIASGDKEFGVELWPTILASMEYATSTINQKGEFIPCPDDWLFFDWQGPLDRNVCGHAAIIYAMKATDRLARIIGKEAIYTYKTAIAAQQLLNSYRPTKRCFVSGPNQQVSWLTQAWVAMTQIVPPETAKQAIITAMKDPLAIMPRTPYAYHYVVEGLVACDAKTEAKELIKSYWGGMVERGADTFWEAYDPCDSLFSPYGDVLNNSFCHAWSCTPSYFLRNGTLD